MNVELTKFNVKKVKSELVDEWLKFLNDNIQDVLITLEVRKYMSRLSLEKYLTEMSIYIGTLSLIINPRNEHTF